MNKPLKYFSFLLVMLCTSCGEYESLEIIKSSRKSADSLFRTQRDSLNQIADSLCHLKFKAYYNASVDSLKDIRLEKIRKLMER